MIDKALALWLCWKIILTKMEDSETNEVFIRREKRVCVDRHTGRLSCRAAPSWQFKSLTWSISSSFPLASHFDVPGSYLVYLRILPCMHMPFLAKMDSAEEACG